MLNCVSTNIVFLEMTPSVSYPDVFESEHEYQEPCETSKQKRKVRPEKKNGMIKLSWNCFTSLK